MPKQRGYHYIVLPERSYTTFNRPGYPYSFQLPVYSEAVKDSVFFNEAPENPYWLNIIFPEFKAQIHLTYKTFSGIDELDKLVADSYKLTFKHTVKAEYIDEQPISAPGLGGMLYEVGGDAATPIQFFLTDSSRHFLRGALYFAAEPNADSLSPVTTYLREDIILLMETLRWK
jgi:gliding motility-associated lipoprotein GldD